ncbi:MAG: hypothetical protein OEM96_05090 [Gemmatimonadota bacterium]|nr:hypothetical protein [Gemmatimonadota bacterium]
MHWWRELVIAGFVTISVLAFSACGSDATGPGGGGGNGGGEVPELPEIPPAAQIFRDDLDSENGGVGQLNYATWTHWNVVEGCVDLHGPGSLNPLPGNGVYIDMDGSCDDGSGVTAGTMETKQGFVLAPGNYTFELLIAGNNQIAQVDTLAVRIGTELNVEIVLGWTAPLALIDFDFVVAATTTETIEMIHSGGDDQGTLIDAVRLRRN